MKKKSLLVTFEGGDACGKSTQIELLKKWFRKNKVSLKVLREPGYTKLGEGIRNILLHGDKYKLSSFVEFQLFTTARRQLVEEVVIPFLNRGKGVLVLDRFYDSTYVYQGEAGDLNMKRFLEYEKESRGGIKPDITFLLDMPVAAARKRIQCKKDRMEKKSKSYHEKVRRGYLKLAKREPKRFVVIDGQKTPKEIHEIISKCLERRLGI